MNITFRSFGAFDYSRTKDIISKYTAENPDISGKIHDQGDTHMTSFRFVHYDPIEMFEAGVFYNK